MSDESGLWIVFGCRRPRIAGRKSHWTLADGGLERSEYWMGLLFTCTLKVSRMVAGLKIEILQVSLELCWAVEKKSRDDADEVVNISLEWLSLRQGNGGAEAWLGTAGSKV